MPPALREGDADKRLRIVLILTEFPPRIGGMQTHALALASSLHDRGHDVCVVTYRKTTTIESNEADSFDLTLPYSVHRILSRISHEFNLDLCSKLVQEFGPNLVYSSTIFYGELATRCGVKVTARSVGNDVLRPWIVYPFRFASTWVASPIFEQRAYRFFRQLDYPEFVENLWRGARVKRMRESALCHTRIFANSEFTARLLTGVGLEDSQIEELVGGVDVKRFGRTPDVQARSADDNFVIMTACRLVRKKAVDFLIESMPAILQQVPNARLVIVGGGQREKHLRRLAEASVVSDRIEFAGRVEQQEIESHFWASSVFVLASREWVEPRTGLRDVETMGRVLCEANAAGIPVVAARSGGIPSVITDEFNGLLFEPEDGDALAACLKRIATDESLRQRLVLNGRQRATEQFAFSRIVDAHVNSFMEIVESQDVRECESTDDSTMPRQVRMVLDPQEERAFSGHR